MPGGLTEFLETAVAASGLGVLFTNLHFGRTVATPVSPATPQPPAVPEINAGDVSGIMILGASVVLLRGRRRPGAGQDASDEDTEAGSGE